MKKRTLALILCGVIITALLPSFHTAIAAEGEAVIATDKINVRGGPGLSYGIKAEVKKGERYPIAKEEGDWVRLQLSPGKTGWVVSWLISKTAGGADNSSATSGTVTSTDPDLRIRKGPGTSYEVIGKLPQGAHASVLDKNSGWVNISYQGTTGWVSSEYVTADSGGSDTKATSARSGSKSGTVGVSSLNVRSAASHDSAIMTKLSRGTKVSILSEDHGWLKIEANGQKGWAKKPLHHKGF